jgi:hypothetical protein
MCAVMGACKDVRRSLSLPTARDALAQKVLEAPKERVMGARRATGLRRRMEGMVRYVLLVLVWVGGLKIGCGYGRLML